MSISNRAGTAVLLLTLFAIVILGACVTEPRSSTVPSETGSVRVDATLPTTTPPLDTVSLPGRNKIVAAEPVSKVAVGETATPTVEPVLVVDQEAHDSTVTATEVVVETTVSVTPPTTSISTPVARVASPAPSPNATETRLSPTIEGTRPTDQEVVGRSASDDPTPSSSMGREIQGAPPFDLGIPFDPSELAIENGFLSPYGVVRKLKDRLQFGHSGIDVPLVEGAAILAVSDGSIISVLPSADKFPGEIVLLSIENGDRAGEGWVFLVEHIELEPGMNKGETVTRGQQIGTSAVPTGRGNTHMQLSYYFNEFQYSREHTCWVETLGDTEIAEFEEAFARLSGSGRLAASWNDAVDDGQYPLRGLAEDPRFPDGPLPCYPQGTDVRVPAN